jgi:hypothetical protein
MAVVGLKARNPKRLYELRKLTTLIRIADYLFKYESNM